MDKLIDYIYLDRDNDNGELTLRIGIMVDIKVTEYNRDFRNKEISISIKAMNNDFMAKKIIEDDDEEDLSKHMVMYNMFNNDNIRNSVEQEIIKYQNVRSLLPYYREVFYIIKYKSNEYGFRGVLEYEKHKDYIDILNEEERIAELLNNF